MDHTAIVAVGSNRGERVQECLEAIREVAAIPGVRLQGVSRLYETEPVGLEGQQWFINGVFEVSTGLAPLELLTRLLEIETRHGRTRTVRWGPRSLDLDLLFYDEMVLDHPRLTIPHPRLHERRFVLEPLCEIRPTLVHPVLGEPVARLLSTLEKTGASSPRVDVPLDSLMGAKKETAEFSGSPFGKQLEPER